MLVFLLSHEALKLYNIIATDGSYSSLVGLVWQEHLIMHYNKTTQITASKLTREKFNFSLSLCEEK